MSYGMLLIAVLLAASSFAPGVRTMVPLDTVRDLLPRVAPTAIFATLLTAAVTGHSLAALLAGLTTGGLILMLMGTWASR